MSLLEIKNLVARYGRITALKGISLHVEEGEIVTLIGAPSLVFVTLSKSEFAVPDLLRMGGAAGEGGGVVEDIQPERQTRSAGRDLRREHSRLYLGPEHD